MTEESIGRARIEVEARTEQATARILDLRKAMEGPVSYGPMDALKGFTGSRKFMAAIVFGGLATLNTFLQAKAGVALSEDSLQLVGDLLLVAVGAEGAKDLVTAWRAKGLLAQAAAPEPPTAQPATGGK